MPSFICYQIWPISDNTVGGSNFYFLFNKGHIKNYWREHKEAGGDKKQVINFTWPKVGKYAGMVPTTLVHIWSSTVKAHIISLYTAALLCRWNKWNKCEYAATYCRCSITYHGDGVDRGHCLFSDNSMTAEDINFKIIKVCCELCIEYCKAYS